MADFLNLEKYKLPPPLITPVEFMTDEQLIAERGNDFLFDVECFSNYFLVAFKSYATGRVVCFEKTETTDLDKGKLRWIIENFCTIGFNSRNYDMPMVWAAIQGLSCERLHNLSNSLIIGQTKIFQVEKEFKFRIGHFDSIDLQQVAPSAATFCSLKHYGARMHVSKLQELPIDPQKALTYHEQQTIKAYNVVDLDVTGWLYSKLHAAVQLRRSMGIAYGADLRSLSDAQIAERVISVELRCTTGETPQRPKIGAGTRFQFVNPEYVRFYTPELQRLHQEILDTVFVVDSFGKVRVDKNDEWITATNLWKIKIGESFYRLGIGGLHSSEQSKSHWASDSVHLFDRDVASYYPYIILNQKLYPRHIGENFLTVYKEIVDRRIEAKRLGDKTTAESLKICINGCFGKLGSKWSVFYSPELLVQVTLSGQLSLLMLIEMLEWYKIPVVSANTDGIVIKCPQEQVANYLAVVQQWEQITGFQTEETRYKSIHSRDVNNYIAVTEDGKFKAKGAYVNRLSMKEPNRESLMKNPNGTICTEAVMRFLATCREPNPTTIEQTINECKDFSKFIFARRVNGGAVKDDQYIGKVIRWYMRFKEFGCIKYLQDNVHGTKNSVPESTGSYPCMDISSPPKDIDYNWYIRRSFSILKDIGFYEDNQRQLELF